MNIIKLPPVLPGDLDLAEINQQLKDKKAALDWSEVVSAQQKYLEVLLARLDLSDNADVLGIDGAIADNMHLLALKSRNLTLKSDRNLNLPLKSGNKQA